MQGVVKSYDPVNGVGVLLRDTDMAEYAVGRPTP